MSEDSPFVGLEGSLREWALRIDQLAQMASRCPEDDRAPLIVISDYLQSACRRFSAAIQGYEPRATVLSRMTPQKRAEYIQLLFYQVEDATRPREQEEGGAAG